MRPGELRWLWSFRRQRQIMAHPSWSFPPVRLHRHLPQPVREEEVTGGQGKAVGRGPEQVATNSRRVLT